MKEHTPTAVGRLLSKDHPQAPISLPLTSTRPRLSFEHTPRTRTDIVSLVEQLAKESNQAIFIDTSLAWLPVEWWKALLSSQNQIHVTRRVAWELIRFFLRNPDHALPKAIEDKHPSIFLHPEPRDGTDFSAFQYYVTLLSFRRHVLTSAVEQFEAQHGGTPTDKELNALKIQVQRRYGERTLGLNIKPISRVHTDEALVYSAVRHAVTTGQSTKLFSADSDVEEQFYTMALLLTAHYYGMILGDLYVTDFMAFRPKPPPIDVFSKYANAFEPHNAVIIDLKGKLISDFVPRLTTLVPITCRTIGPHYTSETAYEAETTMAAVFAIKTKTLGLSTDKLAGRNIHPWMVPPELRIPGSSQALIAYDKAEVFPDTRMKIAQLDIMLTMATGDPHVQVKVPSNDDQDRRFPVFVPLPANRGIVPITYRARTSARLRRQSG
jgi:hypothetical protein